ncbi:MAG TPA: glycosyl hydrolase [bacterium]|nr:glycosyl hydrolase [bacterium]
MSDGGAYDPTGLTTSLRWRLVGPFRGGRVIAVAGDPERAQVFYFGSTGGGVWRTDDAGWTWRNISDGFLRTASVGALAISPSDPNVLYVGMGESCIRGNVAHGDGVYRSSDGGKTWQHVGLADTRHIARIRVHPRDHDLVYVAAFGHVYGPNPERGVFRSTDGGRQWQRILFRHDRAGACDLSMDATNPRILYAALWEAGRTPWALSSGGPASGLFKTADGGETWTELTDTPVLPRGIRGRIGVAVSPARPERVWAIVEAEEGGIFRSDDGGATWVCVNSDREPRQRPFYFSHIFADPMDAETVYIANLDLWKSVDGGRTFARKSLPHGDHHDLWIDPRDPQRMINGSDGGASISLNGGDSWSTIYNQPTAEMYHVTTDSRVPYRIYGAQQDNSTISIPSWSGDGAITSSTYYDVGASESGYIAVRPDDPDIVYGGVFEGMLTRYDHRNGEVRDITVWPENPAGYGAESLKYRFQWTFPIVLSPHDPHLLYVTGNRVFRTTNEGASWDVVSPDLTRNDRSKLAPSGGPVTRDNVGTEYYCTIFAFGESPVQPGVLWAGSDDGLIHCSRDGGATWQNVTPASLPEWALISVIEPSPHDPGTAYVAATRYKLDDLHPYLLKTHDYGGTWRVIVGGIPDDLVTRAIREDPARRGLLYAGTERGVYFTLDDGAHWHPLQNNLPVVPVHDLVVKDDDLVAATHGRSFWILDDVSPLRQLTDEVARADLHLFRPRAATRLNGHPLSFRKGGARVYRRAGGLGVTAQETADGSGVLLDAGQNPPGGVVVHYYFSEKPAQEVKLAFLDAGGRALREFSSQGVAPPQRSGAVYAVTGDDQAAAVPAERGANRFVWNMRLPGAREVADAAMWFGFLGGPVVPPGTYQARLSVGTRVVTRPFEIRKDPRGTATEEELKEQFTFLLKVRDTLTDVHAAVLSVRDLRAQIQQWVSRAEGLSGSGALAGAAKELSSELESIEDELIQWRAQAFEDTFHFPVRLNNKLATVADLTNMADAAPTRQMREVFAELRAQTDVQLARLETVKAGGCTMFSDALRELGVPPIRVLPAGD